MGNKKYIFGIIFLLLIKIIVSLLGTFLPLHYTSVYVFHSLSDMAILLYLYWYIKIVKGGRLSLIAVILAITALLYFLAVKIYVSQMDKSTIVFDDIMLYQFFTAVFPSVIYFIGQFIISIQLIKNNIDSEIGKAVKIAGITLVIQITGFNLIPILLLTTLSEGKIIFDIIAILPLIAMINVYVKELKHIHSGQ